MKKKLSAALFTIVFTSLGAAAITGGGGTGAGMIFDFFEGLVNAQVDSWMDLLLVVIFPFLGVYGISRYLTGKALEIAEENFRDNSSYGNVELGSTEKRMAQFISLAIAAPVVMFFGGAIPYFSLLLSIIAIIWFGWQFIGGGLSSSWSRGGGEGTSTSNNSSVLKDAGGKAKDIMGWAKNKGSKGIDMAKKANDKRKEDTAAREAASELHQKLQEFNEADKELEEVLERDYGEIRNTLIEDKKAAKLDQEEEEQLEKILNFANKFDSQLSGGNGKKGLLNQMEKSLRQYEAIDGKALIDTTKGSDEFNVAYAPDLNTLQDEAREIANGVKTLQEEAQEEDSLIDDEASTTIEDIKELVEAHEIIDMLTRAANVLEEEDAELEKIARDVHDEELAEEVELEENIEKKIGQQLTQLEHHEEEILKTLKEADEYLRRIVKLDQQEIEEIRSELQEDGKIEKNLAEMEKMLKDMRQGQERVIAYSEVMEEIEGLRGIFNEIDEHLKKLANLKTEEEQEISQVHNEVKEAISKMEGQDLKQKIKSIR